MRKRGASWIVISRDELNLINQCKRAGANRRTISELNDIVPFELENGDEISKEHMAYAKDKPRSIVFSHKGK